ncbi:hypothetical protein ACI798_15760 [Geodermatophilus sp. SYSU D01045]
MLDTTTRVVSRAKREAIARVPPIRTLVERRHERRVQEYASSLPALPADRRALLDDVRRDGIRLVALDDLGLPHSGELWTGLLALKERLAAKPDTGQDTTLLSVDEVLEEPAVWRWGLAQELLDVVEVHLGLPARYYGADLRLERATSRAVGVRQWHRDLEDHRMFKILVWLDDVGPDGGPFEYLDRVHTDRVTRSLGYVSGFVSDQEIEGLVPRSEWRQATGPAGTCLLVDTRSLFHRAMPPRVQDRYSVTFTYTSRRPVTTLTKPPATARQRAVVLEGLDARQRACLSRDFTD